ncbi:metal-dependent hydrolase [Halorubrum sp. DTA46]|uniref:metal-dependent hydrolase n=1 Tax=Halorubrum sp. DTA46 TaxID=3402162 RepID=UPI003AB0FD00
MWPWEHVLFAYVFYSVYIHVRYHRRPSDAPVVALAFGSVLPDLIDKPLAWQFNVFEGGYALAHSVFFVVPLAAVVYLYAKRRGRGAIGAAFGVGYLFHLVGDVLPVSLARGSLDLTPMLWPIAGAPRSADRASRSFLDGVYTLLVEYMSELATLNLTSVIALQIGSLVFGLVLWAYDGFPGPRILLRWIRVRGRTAVRQ